MSSLPVSRPTAEECSARATVPLEGGPEGGKDHGTAFWWPQMDGYAAPAVVYRPPGMDGNDSGCFDVFVWHDGLFPFDGQCNNCASPRQPVHMHLCSAEQWLEMAALFGRISGTITEITRKPWNPLISPMIR